MYYGRENTVAWAVGDKFMGYYGRNSDYSKAIEKLVASVLGFCPPFDARVNGGKLEGTLSIDFFNEFDPRKIAPEKMREIIAAMNASGEYQVVEEAFSSDSLTVSYRKN